MNKVVLLILILALAAPLLAQGPQRDRKNGPLSDHIHEFKPRGKGNIKASIRKCLDVKCEPGFKCFHGRCIESDDKCATIRCAAGYRCVKGNCVPRKHQARKTVCSPLGFSVKRENCDSQLLKECKQAKLMHPTCGFNKKTR